MDDNDIRAKALERLCRAKRAMDNARAPFAGRSWDQLPEPHRKPYRAAMEPYVDALADMLCAPRPTLDPYAVVGDLLALIPTRITTVEELDALPEGTVIRSRYGIVAQKAEDAWEFPNEVGRSLGEIIDLPATVLWNPEATHA